MGDDVPSEKDVLAMVYIRIGLELGSLKVDKII